MKKNSIYLLLMGLIISVLLVGCGGENSSSKDSTGKVGEQVDYKIVGIDPGAGLMKATDKVIKEYQLKDWELVEGSSAAMTAELTKAYEKKEPIIVTAWTPHWMFSKFDMKYLEDPKKTYGDEESINTIVRKGLKADKPSAYAFLDEFYWEPADMESVMVAIQEGKDPAEVAKDWVKNNNDKVSKWSEGIKPVNGDEISLAYVAWDSEIASVNVVAVGLEKLGYKVELSQVEAGPMWAGVGTGDVDAIVAAWLPTTHADYYAKFKDSVEDLGANLKGTRLGLAVPSYMKINSIEDLNQ